MKRLYVTQQTMSIDEVTKLGKTREEMQKMYDENTWPQKYLVTKVVQSTTPRIGSYLTEAEVKEYCENHENWQVEIK